MANFVDAQAVADHFGVRVETVHAWRRRGWIPAIRAGQSVVRFDLAEVERALRARAGDTPTPLVSGGVPVV